MKTFFKKICIIVFVSAALSRKPEYHVEYNCQFFMTVIRIIFLSEDRKNPIENIIKG